MSDTLTTDETPAPGTRLIARIVDRHAAPSDYDGFVALARVAPGHWDELLSALRDDDALHGALQASLEPAEQVGLPIATPPRAGLLRTLHPWTGWLAAAALALVWLARAGTQQAALPASPEPYTGLAHLPGTPLRSTGPRPRDPSATQGDHVLGDLPLRLVSTQPSSDGAGLDLLYVQPVLRRARVDHVFEVGMDEHGRPAPVPVDPAVLAQHESL